MRRPPFGQTIRRGEGPLRDPPRFWAASPLIEDAPGALASRRRPTRPTIVSINGSPAATSEPNASARIASVIGHEKSSDFIIAVRFAVLKSDHSPEAPVRLTSTPFPPLAARVAFRSSAARTIPLGSRRAPASITAVWPSRAIETPGCGPTTVVTASLDASDRSTRVTAFPNAGSPKRCWSEWTTAISAELESPRIPRASPVSLSTALLATTPTCMLRPGTTMCVPRKPSRAASPRPQ